VLKDSIEKLNPKFRINVLAVAEAVFDDAHAQNPLEYAMWAKNADPAADPNFYMQAYQHPDGEWGEVHGFANGYKDADKVAELIDAAAVELDTGKRAALYKELNEILYNDPMWLIGAQEGVVMAHRDWLKGFVQNPLWPRPSLKFALFDK
jgi:peptide/nickel transport system substrate-binding protein